MKNWNTKMILVVFLTGILISTGYAATEETFLKDILIILRMMPFIWRKKSGKNMMIS